MTNKVTAYSYDEHGRITGSRTGEQENVAASMELISDSFVYSEPLDGNIPDYYVSSGVICKKTPCTSLQYDKTVQVGGTITIYGIPVGAKVTWPDNATSIETDGSLYTSTQYAVPHKFVIDHPAHFVIEVVVNVEA